MKTFSRYFLLCAAVAMGLGPWPVVLAQPTPPTPPTQTAPTAPTNAGAPAPDGELKPEAPAAKPTDNGGTTPAPATSAANAAPAPTTEVTPKTEPAKPADPARNPGKRSRTGRGVGVVPGVRNGDLVRVMGDNTVGPDSRIRGKVVTVMGNTTVNGTVDRDVVSVMGDVTIDGTVHGKVVAAMGNITLGPKAKVDGDIICKVGEVTREEGAVVGGRILELGESDGVGFELPLQGWWEHGLRFGRPIGFGPGIGWVWGASAMAMALYVLLSLAFPDAIRRCGDTLMRRPVMSIFSPMLVLLALPILFILLCVTVVGIPVALLVLPLGFVTAVLFGRAAIYTLAGRLVVGERLHPVLSLVTGGLLFLVLYFLPVVGLMVWVLVAWLGLGCVITTLLSSSGKKPLPPAASAAAPNRPAPVAPTPAPAPAMPAPSAVAVGSSGFAGGAVVDPVVGAAVGSAPTSGAAAFAPTVVVDAPAGTLAGGLAAVAVEPATGDFPAMSPGFGAASGAATPEPAMSPPPVSPPVEPRMPSASFVPPPRVAGAVPSRAPYEPTLSAVGLPRAGFWIRAGALGIDGVIIAVCFGPWAGPAVLPILALYGALMWKFRGTTVGGIVCGLQVVRLDDRPLDWPTVAVRALGCFLSLVVIGLGFVWVAFDEEKQSWHDKIAGTTVVRPPGRRSLV